MGCVLRRRIPPEVAAIGAKRVGAFIGKPFGNFQRRRERRRIGPFLWLPGMAMAGVPLAGK